MSTGKDHLREVHGVAPSFTDADAIRVGKAFLVALAGGSKLTEQELARIGASAKSYGVSDAAIAACVAFPYWKAEASEHLIDDARLGRHLAYEASRTCRAGGTYGPAEKARVAKATKQLGVPAAALGAIEGLLEGESAIAKGRAALAGALKQSGGTLPPGAQAAAREVETQATALRDARIRLFEGV